MGPIGEERIAKKAESMKPCYSAAKLRYQKTYIAMAMLIFYAWYSDKI